MRFGLQRQARLLRTHRVRRYPEVREREAVADEMIAPFQVTVEYAAELVELLIGIDASRRIGIDVASNVSHGADYLLEVKANQPGWRKAIKPFFADAPPEAQGGPDNIDKGHGRIEERRVCVSRDEGRPSGNLCLAPQPVKLNSSPWDHTRLVRLSCLDPKSVYDFGKTSDVIMRRAYHEALNNEHRSRSA